MSPSCRYVPMGGNPSGSSLPSVLLSPGLLAVSKIQFNINIRGKLKGKSKMNNPERHETLGTRHRTKTTQHEKDEQHGPHQKT